MLAGSLVRTKTAKAPAEKAKHLKKRMASQYPFREEKETGVSFRDLCGLSDEEEEKQD